MTTDSITECDNNNKKQEKKSIIIQQQVLSQNILISSKNKCYCIFY